MVSLTRSRISRPNEEENIGWYWYYKGHGCALWHGVINHKPFTSEICFRVGIEGYRAGSTEVQGLSGAKSVGGSNSLRATNAINIKEHVPWYCQNLVLEMQKLALEFDIITSDHVYRETNRAGKYLATLTTDVKEECTFIPLVDSKLCNITEEDKSDMIYVRLWSVIKKMCNQTVPTMVCLFFWALAWGRTLTKENLRKRGQFVGNSKSADKNVDWGKHLGFHYTFSKLKSIEIKNLEGCQNELVFLELLLKNAPLLENLTITTVKALSMDKVNRLAKISKNLQSLPKASSNLTVLFHLNSGA
ncbi:hypothetical protein IFM89_033788 [Coptis chinensis]|uniref:FBD domain-containing protein n=1 Tax=Coptis chinensis TaxID=261450 RepID=A0A835HRT2_9MAGN|nr:hypothetical protein IFM89_033788 [Coptis chinensis]